MPVLKEKRPMTENYVMLSWELYVIMYLTLHNFLPLRLTHMHNFISLPCQPITDADVPGVVTAVRGNWLITDIVSHWGWPGTDACLESQHLEPAWTRSLAFMQVVYRGERRKVSLKPLQISEICHPDVWTWFLFLFCFLFDSCLWCNQPHTTQLISALFDCRKVIF